MEDKDIGRPCPPRHGKGNTSPRRRRRSAVWQRRRPRRPREAPWEMHPGSSQQWAFGTPEPTHPTVAQTACCPHCTVTRLGDMRAHAVAPFPFPSLLPRPPADPDIPGHVYPSLSLHILSAGLPLWRNRTTGTVYTGIGDEGVAHPRRGRGKPGETQPPRKDGPHEDRHTYPRSSPSPQLRPRKCRAGFSRQSPRRRRARCAPAGRRRPAGRASRRSWGGQTREQRQRPCLPPCASGSHGFRTDAPGQLRSAPGRGVRWDLCCSGGLCEETCCHPLPAADCRAGCAADTLSDHSMAQRTAAGFCPELCPPPSAGQVMRNPTAPKGCSLWNTRTPPPSQHSASSCPFLDQHLSNANSTRRSTTSTMSHCRMI